MSKANNFYYSDKYTDELYEYRYIRIIFCPTKMIDSIYLQIIVVLFDLSSKCDILKIL